MKDESREEELKRAERLKDKFLIDEWLMQEAIRSGQPKPMLKIKNEFDPKACDILVEIVERYRQKPS